eukprot:TRINITY_DN11411_c0_g2_i2.p1 TRINITY_DN11411_c0_g2~~TRINITY_DN11411_c0_g2_i2.p1  ORF type:complete len:1367 (-),score=274.51 TRINITY_DN11411_c0_g2_i2:288-4388(-)
MWLKTKDTEDKDADKKLPREKKFPALPMFKKRDVATITLMLHTSYRGYDVIVELPGISCYYDVMSAITRVLVSCSHHCFFQYYLVESFNEDISQWSELSPTTKFSTIKNNSKIRILEKSTMETVKDESDKVLVRGWSKASSQVPVIDATTLASQGQVIVPTRDLGNRPVGEGHGSDRLQGDIGGSSGEVEMARRDRGKVRGKTEMKRIEVGKIKEGERTMLSPTTKNGGHTGRSISPQEESIQRTCEAEKQFLASNDEELKHDCFPEKVSNIGFPLTCERGKDVSAVLNGGNYGEDSNRKGMQTCKGGSPEMGGSCGTTRYRTSQVIEDDAANDGVGSHGSNCGTEVFGTDSGVRTHSGRAHLRVGSSIGMSGNHGRDEIFRFRSPRSFERIGERSERKENHFQNRDRSLTNLGITEEEGKNLIPTLRDRSVTAFEPSEGLDWFGDMRSSKKGQLLSNKKNSHKNSTAKLTSSNTTCTEVPNNDDSKKELIPKTSHRGTVNNPTSNILLNTTVEKDLTKGPTDIQNPTNSNGILPTRVHRCEVKPGLYLVSICVEKRMKYEYLEMNLKHVSELPVPVSIGGTSICVVTNLKSQPENRWRSLNKTHSTQIRYWETYVIPFSFGDIEELKISDFLEIKIFSFSKNNQQPPLELGRAMVPLSPLDKGKDPEGVLVKLDKGGVVDIELSWFEDVRPIVSSTSKQNYKQSIMPNFKEYVKKSTTPTVGTTDIFFKPPPKGSKKQKKALKEESAWFQSLSEVPPQRLMVGDILLQKNYDISLTTMASTYSMVVQLQRELCDPYHARATQFTCHAAIVVDGGQVAEISPEDGPQIVPTVPNKNWLVYRCKDVEYAHLAAAWASNFIEKVKERDVKYSIEHCFANPTQTEPDNLQKQVGEFPPLVSDDVMEMVCSEFICRAYQCHVAEPKITIYPLYCYPMKLEDYLNFHLGSHFILVGMIPIDLEKKKIEDEELARKKVSQKTPKPTTWRKKKDKEELFESSTTVGSGGADEKMKEDEGCGVYPCPVFGISLEKVYGDGSVIPHLWDKMFHFLSSEESVSTVGIFRIPGLPDEVEYYQRQFDLGKEVTFKCNCHDVVGLLKKYIRSLPDPIVPNFYSVRIPILIDRYSHDPHCPELIQELQTAFASLHPSRLKFLSMLISVLTKIVRNDSNKMNLENVIRCIVPTMGCGPQIVTYGINHYEEIWAHYNESQIFTSIPTMSSGNGFDQKASKLLRASTTTTVIRPNVMDDSDSENTHRGPKRVPTWAQNRRTPVLDQQNGLSIELNLTGTPPTVGSVNDMITTPSPTPLASPNPGRVMNKRAALRAAWGPNRILEEGLTSLINHPTNLTLSHEATDTPDNNNSSSSNNMNVVTI